MSAEIGDTGQISLNHIGIAVKDAEATSKFLTSMWGIGPWKSRDYVPPREEVIVGEPFVLKIMVAKLGPTIVELLQPVESPKSVWAQFIETNGEGIHHIALRVLNWDECVSKLKEQGATVLVKANHKGVRWCYMEMKPGGIVVELMEGPGVEP